MSNSTRYRWRGLAVDFFACRYTTD